MRIAQKAEAFLVEAGLEAHEVPLPVLMPILEASGNVEDESMADRWAALLANAATGDDSSVPPSYPDILRQLTPAEARLLDALYDNPGQGSNAMGMAIDAGLASRWAEAFDNLVRLRLAAYPFRAGPIASQDASQLAETALGRAFVAVCRPPARQAPSFHLARLTLAFGTSCATVSPSGHKQQG